MGKSETGKRRQRADDRGQKITRHYGLMAK
jgi:hypothetical protein